MPTPDDQVLDLGGSVLWAATPDGRIIYSRGRGLEQWGLRNGQAVGSTIDQWPDPLPFRYAVAQFRAGSTDPIYVEGAGEYARVEVMAPVVIDGSLVVVGDSIPTCNITPREVMEAWADRAGV